MNKSTSLSYCQQGQRATKALIRAPLLRMAINSIEIPRLPSTDMPRPIRLAMRLQLKVLHRRVTQEYNMSAHKIYKRRLTQVKNVKDSCSCILIKTRPCFYCTKGLNCVLDHNHWMSRIFRCAHEYEHSSRGCFYETTVIGLLSSYWTCLLSTKDFIKNCNYCIISQNCQPIIHVTKNIAIFMFAWLTHSLLN